MSAFDWKRLKVLVGIPSLGYWNEQFGMSLAAMISHFHQHEVPGYRKQEISICSVKGSILPRMRRDIVRRAQTLKCTHLLFIDCDQAFPRETLHRLLWTKKDVIAANIAVKRIPSAPTARMFKEGDPRGEPLYTPENSEELEKVWRVGTGIMLINMKVIEATGPDIFHILWRPEHQDYQGEDWSMCEAFEKAGFEIWVDHGLSNRVTHIGDYPYDHNVVGEMKDGRLAAIGGKDVAVA